MKAFKVPLRKAERAKKELIRKDIYDKSYLPKKDKNNIYFPVKKETKIKTEGKFVETDLPESEKINSYKELLTEITKEESDLLPSSYDIIGDIIIVEIPEELEHIEKKIGEALLEAHKNVKTVLKKAGIHSGEFRTQELKHLAGKKKKETTYKENNIKLKLDVEKVYFSPRLSSERKRIYKQIKAGEKVLVMFSGCGPYPITIAKNTRAEKIVGIEKNPLAHEYAQENSQLNNVDNVELIQGDVREKVPKLKEKFDRIIMPLPKDAETFLDLIPSIVKSSAFVHVYVFAHNEKEAKNIVEKENKKNKINVEIKHVEVCGQYSPCLYRMCVDMKMHAH